MTIKRIAIRRLTVYKQCFCYSNVQRVRETNFVPRTNAVLVGTFTSVSDVSVSTTTVNSPPSIYCFKILTWLRGFLVIFLHLVLFSLCSSLFWELRHNGCREKFVILTLKPRSHFRILIYLNVGCCPCAVNYVFTCWISSFSLWYPHDDRWPKRMEHGCLMEVLWKLTLCMPT